MKGFPTPGMRHQVTPQGPGVAVGTFLTLNTQDHRAPPAPRHQPPLLDVQKSEQTEKGRVSVSLIPETRHALQNINPKQTNMLSGQKPTGNVSRPSGSVGRVSHSCNVPQSNVRNAAETPITLLRAYVFGINIPTSGIKSFTRMNGKQQKGRKYICFVGSGGKV